MLIDILIVLIIVGLALWLFNTFITFIDSRIKQIINAVAIGGVVIWLLLQLRGIL
jgi:type IV secretory pathway TrbL component